MGVQLVQGRLIPDNIRPNSPQVAVISETMARTLWPGADPIGQRISRLPGGAWREVIGVVRDVSFATELGAPDTRMQIYDSLVQDPWGYFTIILRGASAETLAQPLRRAVSELDPDLPVYFLRTVEAAVDESQHFYRLAMQVMGGFAATSSFLTAVGLYGVIAGMVFRRTREFGIRIALGAQPRDVWWPVLWNGWRLALVGIGCGVIGVSAAIRLVAAVVPALPTQTPLVVAGMGALVFAITGLACWIPARCAAKVNPLLALQTE
jgi:ABC-type antimicrobial peptide transport system permease subunit